MSVAFNQHNVARVSILALLAFAVVSPSSAQDTVLVTYQGYLTDATGAPVSGSPSMRFAIYDALGTSVWSETYLMVSVSSGTFNVLLGSRTPLPSSVFDGSERYLGVRVGVDPEMTPRTLLTATPGAAYARSLAGDVATGPGKMVLKTPTGDSAIVLTSGSSVGGVFDNAESFSMGGNLTITVDPDASGLLMTQGSGDDPPDVELGAGIGSNFLRLHPPEPGVLPDRRTPSVNIEAGEQTVDFDLAITLPDDDVVEPLDLGSSLIGGSTHLNLMAPDGNAAFHVSLLEGGGFATGWFSCPGCEVMGVEPSPFHPERYSLLMYDQGSLYPAAPKLELFCGGGQGAGFDIFDDAGKVMGVEPSPFNSGYGIKLLDPALPDAPPIVEISSLYSDGVYGKVNVGLTVPPDDIKPGVQLSSAPSAGKIIVGGPQPMVGGPPKMIVMEANSAVAEVGIGTDTPSEALHVVGNVYITGDYLRLTDTRAKANVQPIANALNKVEELNGVTYDLSGEMAGTTSGTANRQVGFLAQEVEQVLPEAVKTMNDGFKAVDYSRLTALLVEAVKELKSENEDLRRRVEALESL